METELHRLFKNKRVRGEWFNLDIDDLIILNKKMEKYT
ncbi:GIY-YIG nuclease family protein [Tenacibaculum amylolyticum]